MEDEQVSQTPPSSRFGVETGEQDDGLLTFFDLRPRLYGIAYRMLGTAAERRISCKTFGCGGSPRIGVRLRTRRVPGDDNHTIVYQPRPIRPLAP
jgi:hypothetical protein